MCERVEEDRVLPYLFTRLQFFIKSQFVLFCPIAFNEYLNFKYQHLFSGPYANHSPSHEVAMKCYPQNNGECWQMNSI